METYKIKINNDFLGLLPEVKNLCAYGVGASFDYKLIGRTGQGVFYEENEVEIQCENASTLFWIGFFLERLREEQQRRHYDLRDSNEITITVPDAFLLVCKAFGLNPSLVLSTFTGNLSFHPFITLGSDERRMAYEYFMRAYSTEEKDEALFHQLEALRRSWQGNEHQEEFKKRYRETIQALTDEIINNKKGASNEPK